MPDDTQILEARKGKLLAEIEAERNWYLRNARWNYFTAQGMSWSSLAASGAAALLGLIPSSVDKWVVGILAALSTALIAASRQLGLQQKANGIIEKWIGSAAPNLTERGQRCRDF
jgi:hypothetical protein